jgi:NAD-dependent deacetylase
LARPGVVWFGEPLPAGMWLEAEHAAGAAEVVLVIGTSAVVYPAASLITVARAAKAKIIEVNLEETPISREVDCSLRGPSGEILPKLVA